MKVAVVGATGAVGETILRVLEERDLPIETMRPFASRDRMGGARFRGRDVDVSAASRDSLRGFDVVFFAGGEDAAEEFAPALLAGGSIVIDNSSTFRMRDDVPLIVPNVNAHAVRAEHRLFPVANCTAIVLCTALRPIRDAAGLRAVRAATYQAASGAGRAGLDELLAGERAIAEGSTEPRPSVFPRALARNVVPQVGAFDDAGWSSEEKKIGEESRKMLDLPQLVVSATAVRVPVRTAHSAAVFVETQRATKTAELEDAFEAAQGVIFHREGVVTPRDVEGTDSVHVARLREEDATHFAFWCVGDQLRKGAATNAVEILQLLLEKGYVAR
jgi:aspartate-semialdehyde dehydrogenase